MPLSTGVGGGGRLGICVCDEGVDVFVWSDELAPLEDPPDVLLGATLVTGVAGGGVGAAVGGVGSGGKETGGRGAASAVA